MNRCQALYRRLTQNVGQFSKVSLKIIQLGTGNQKATFGQEFLMEIGIGKGNAVSRKYNVGVLEERCLLVPGLIERANGEAWMAGVLQDLVLIHIFRTERPG